MSLSFFQDNDSNDESVTEMSEANAVQWIFRNQTVRDLFFRQFFDSNCLIRAFFNLGEPFTKKNEKPGDIDLMLVDVSRPDRVIAFECKRVMTTTTQEGEAKVHHVSGKKLIKGIVQANNYQSLGFFKTYLMVIILDNCRLKITPNIITRHTKSEQASEVYHIPFHEELHRDVGVVYVKITQPTGQHVNMTAGVGVCLHKQAVPQDQQVSITNKVKELLKNS